VTFFFDNCVPIGLVHILRILGVSAVHLSERMDPTTADDTWIPQVAAEGRIIVTSNDWPHKEPAMDKIVQQVRATVVYLPMHRDQKLWQQAEYLVRHWPRITQELEAARRPGFFRATEKGRLR